MSVGRVLTIVRADLKHNLRRPIFWFWVAILAFMSWGLSSGDVRIASGDSNVGGTEAWLTSQFSIALLTTILVLMIYAFFVAVAAGMLVIRDAEQRVVELLNSTPLEPGEYIWARFVGATLTFIVILALHMAFMAVIFHVIPRAAMDDMRGPFELANYLIPALVFGVPTIIFVGGTSFAIGTMTRKPIVVFIIPVALIMACGFFLWQWSPNWLDHRINRALMFLEPTGFRWLNETYLKVDRGVDFYNSSPIRLDALIIANRVVLLALGLGAVALASRRFKRTIRGAFRVKAAASGEPVGSPQPVVDAVSVSAPPVPIRKVRPPGLITGTARVARFELRELRYHPGLYLFAPLILIQTIGAAFFAVGAFGTPLLQTPGTLAVSTMNTLTLLVCLLIQFYTVESLQRDRNTGTAAMLYATPVRSASLLLGKAIANAAVGGVILVTSLIGCLVVLAFQRTVPISLVPFALVWGAILIPTFIFWSAFVMAVASLLRNRYTTHGICLAVLIATGYRQLTGDMNWVLNWDAWGVIVWSDMGPLELNRTPLLLNRLLVLSATALLIAITGRIFSRRDFDAARIVHRLRPRALLGYALRLLPFVVVPAALAGTIWVGVLDGFQGDRMDEDQKDYWRRNVATWRETTPAATDHVELDVRLDPPRRWFRTEGHYVLRNPGDEPLEEIAITGGPHWENLSWTMNGEPYEPDDRSHLFVFTPPTPLGPDETVEVGFSFEGVYPRGFTRNGGGTGEFILPSGVVLTSFGPSFVPNVGYMDGIGVDDDNSHDARDFADDFFEGRTDPAFGSGWPYTTRISITGPAEYRYNSVGALVSEEVVEDMRTAVWESDYPVTFFNVVAGKWDVRLGEGTAIYHHPEHTYNIDEMIEALDAARKYYSEWFYEYPWTELKLSEFANLATYAQGFGTNITFSESIGFLTKSEPKTRLAFVVTAHEAAHQWWGNLLRPGKGPGGNILSEGMAHFSTVLLTGQVKGDRDRMEFCKSMESTYGDSRRVDSERPLVEIDGSRPGDTTVTYDKGGWVFWMLLQLMGRDACLAGMQEFIADYHVDDDHPVLQDFVRAMRPFAPDPEAYDAYVDDWFFSVVVPEYRLSDVSQTPGEAGTVVTVTVENRGTGTMPVTVAAARGERFDDDGATSADYRDARVTATIEAGEQQTLTIPCDFEPERVVVDPDVHVLMLNRHRAEQEL